MVKTSDNSEESYSSCLFLPTTGCSLLQHKLKTSTPLLLIFFYRRLFTAEGTEIAFVPVSLSQGERGIFGDFHKSN